MDDNHKPLIRLWATEDIGLIILWKTGVLIANQTCGHTCLQPEEEGVYIPLHRDLETHGPLSYTDRLEDLFENLHGVGIDNTLADKIDDLLTHFQFGILNFLRVDRSRLGDSHEAWVYVDVADSQPERMTSTIYGFGVCKGVLTWVNSD